MSAVADDIAASGYRPGLWLAPFYVEAGADLYADHPGGSSRSRRTQTPTAGTPVDGGFRAGSELYGLDTTHPAVLEWLRETVSTVVDDWGFTYLKLDFPLCGGAARRAVRRRGNRIEAYRRGRGDSGGGRRRCVPSRLRCADGPECRALRRDAGRPRHRSGLGDSGSRGASRD